MKKVIISSLLTCSVIFAAQTMTSEEKGCVENLESEIVKIVNSDVASHEKQKAIDELKTKVEIGAQEDCESEFQADIKKMVFGDKKPSTSQMVKNHVKKIKESPEAADMSAKDCVDNFEAEVLKIVNSNPNNSNKDETHKVLQEIMHDKVVESCESEFEKDTKEIVNKK